MVNKTVKIEHETPQSRNVRENRRRNQGRTIFGTQDTNKNKKHNSRQTDNFKHEQGGPIKKSR